MNHFNRDRVIGMVSGVGFAGLLFGAFAFGWWSRGSQLVAVGPTVISAPPAAVAAPAPDLSSPDVMAADFERRHPPLAIPAVFEKSVLFQLGLTQFAPGDSITITDIRGTSDSFAPGSVYQIKGTYTLASHESADLSVYVTSRYKDDGVSIPQKCQNHADLTKGHGDFTLILPMRCEGWPHISLYADGHNIGGVYFGAGDSLLTHW